MNLKIIIFFSLIFLISLFLFFPVPVPENNSVLQEIFFSTDSFTVNNPAELKGKYFYEKGITSIEFNSLKQECFNQKECEFSFETVFVSPGTQEIIFKINSEKEFFKVKKIIKVMDLKKCINGSVHGECIENNYCNNGVIEFNCIKCPCSANYECIENKCVLKKLNLELIELITPKLIGENLSLKTNFSLNFFESIPKETELKINLLTENKLISSKTIILNESKIQSHSIEFPIDLSPGKHDFLLEFEFNSEKILETKFNSEIIPKTSIPPNPPKQLTAVSYNNSVDLNWINFDSTVISFNVYKSISVQSTHISYSFIDSTKLNSFNFDSLEKGTHYFVVTAVNVFGLESEYSELEKIEIR